MAKDADALKKTDIKSFSDWRLAIQVSIRNIDPSLSYTPKK